jgi:hypothetical protein
MAHEPRRAMPHTGRPKGRRSYTGRREALATCRMLCDADGDDTSDSGGGPSARDCFISRCCSGQRIHQRHCNKLRRYNASQTELQVQRDGSAIVRTVQRRNGAYT